MIGLLLVVGAIWLIWSAVVDALDALIVGDDDASRWFLVLIGVGIGLVRFVFTALVANAAVGTESPGPFAAVFIGFYYLQRIANRLDVLSTRSAKSTAAP